jgi:FMN phosphatase YigB (HAD superfamily)/DNA-binding XRE family transcriptional regulator
MAMDEKGLGRRLQEARVQSGFTQQALCQKAGLSYSTLTKIERGAIKSPSIFTIQSIASALGVGLDELMGNTPVGMQVQKHRSKSGISFVYFDINGCLVRFYQRAFTELAEATEVSADIIETTFWHYNDQVCRGDMTMDEFNKVFAKALGIPSVNWIEYYLAAIDPIPVMQEMVGWAAQNYRVGLLTNIMPGFITAMRGRKLIPDIAYDVIIDSSEVHAIKPESAIYDLATKKAGVQDASEILFVDDSRMNLMAAEKQGWRVLWFDDYRPEESVARIRSSLEIAD